MARKTFEECKKGDTMYLLDLENNLELKKVKLREKARWCNEDSYRCDVGLGGHLIMGCVKTRSRSENLFTTEEEALAVKASIEKGEKVYYTVRKGDTAYVVLDNKDGVQKATFTNNFTLKGELRLSYNGQIIRIGSAFWREALDNKSSEYWNYDDKIRVYLNEKDALKSIKDAERRQKKNATDKYLKSLENHDGKPISHTDNLGSALHYGDTVAYIRRVGINGHPELRKGVIVGEAKTTITVFDEDEKKNGKPGMWRREPNEESHGKHSLQPQSVLLFKLAEVNEKSGFILTK